MPARPQASAPGDRAVALVNSSNNVVFTGDLILGAEAPSDDVLLLARAIERTAPRCVRRAAPLNRPPSADADRIDREAAIDLLGTAIAERTAVNVVGNEGVGKSYVLRAAVGGRPPDGVVWIDGEGRDADDVLQAVFHELYDAPQTVADRERRRAAFGDLRALVVVDGGDKAAPEAQRIREELPNCGVLLASRADAGWSAGATSLGVSGLERADAVELVERRTGPLDDSGRDAAGRLIELLAGNPRRLWQAAGLSKRASLPLPTLAAALTGDPEGELRRLLLDALEPADRSLVETLAGACGATLAAARLRALTAIPDAGARLQRLEEDGYVQSGSPRYRLAGALVGVQGKPERVAKELTEFARTVSPDEVAGELPAALAILAWAARHERSDIAIGLGRAIAPAAVYGRRWGAWGEVLERVLDAARHARDAASEAWALHHVGTLAYASGQQGAAVAALTDALALRERLGDQAGAAATKHNLDFILEPLAPPPNGGGQPAPPGPRRGAWLLGVGVVVALAVGGVVAIAGNSSRSGSPVIGGEETDSGAGGPGTTTTNATGTDRRPPSITILAPAPNERYREGEHPVTRFRCKDNVRVKLCDGTVDGKPLEADDSRRGRHDVLVNAHLPMVGGTHVLRVTATDTAGHRGLPKVLRYSVLKPGSSTDVVPIATIKRPQAGAKFAPSDLPPADFTCTPDTAQVTCAGVVTSPGQPDVPVHPGDPLPAKPGTYTLTATATYGKRQDSDTSTYTVETATVNLTISLQVSPQSARVVWPAGSVCPDVCSARVASGEPLTLRGERLDQESQQWVPGIFSWTGGCENTGETCTVTPGDSDLTVTVRNPYIG